MLPSRMGSLNWVAALLLLCIGLGGSAMAFDMSVNTNLAVYWGQNSYGASNPNDTTNWQQPISYYCADNMIDTIPIAFLSQFYSTGGLPSMNLANTCTGAEDAVFPGTNLPNCDFLASDIEACQAAGKIVTISLGGATLGAGFSNDTEGTAYAQIIWDLFLGGSSTTRPFGAAVLDGIDMDIEGGSQTGYSAFLTALRTLMNGGDKQYYITAAPQCPYPDAYIGTTLNEVEFDAVYVQFYDNYCGLTSFSNPDDWDYSQWDTWATTVSPNPNVKVYIGAPGSSAAASSGYVNASTMATIIQQTRSSYSSFGGVMLWDASAAYANGRYDMAVKAVLTGSTGGTTTTTASTSTTTTSYTSTTTPHTTNTTSHTSTTTSHKSKATSHTSTTTSPTTTKATTTTTTTAPATTTTPSTGSCAGVVPWQPHLAYVGGDEVTYGGDLWTAKWWSEADVPGGVAGDWINDGACT